MNKIKHSPGNWQLNRAKDAVITDAHVETNFGNLICVSPARGHLGQAVFNHSEPFWLENAKLISRAPNLLKQNIELIAMLERIVSQASEVVKHDSSIPVQSVLSAIVIAGRVMLKECHDNRFLTTH